MLVKFQSGKYLVIAGFAVLLLYNFHRYIFQYNFEGTSPTYTNTPVTWKMGKYVIMVFFTLLFYLGLSYKQKKLSINFYLRFGSVYVLVLFVLIINILNVVVYGEASTEEFQYCVWFILVIPYWFADQYITDFNINFPRMITFAAIVLYLSNAVAIANFYMTGRLPALGYEGGLVRFGGFWDDPNAFGIVCVFLFYYFCNRKRYFLALLAVLNIVFTFSFTAYLVMVLAVGYWIFPSYKTISIKWLFASIALLFLVVFIIIINFEKLVELYEIKADSIDEHLNKELVFNILPLTSSSLQFTENWYKSVFNNYFPIAILIELVFFIFFASLFLNSKNRELKFYFFLFVFCSFFFSMLYVFPLNFTFIFLLADHLKRTSQISNFTPQKSTGISGMETSN